MERNIMNALDRSSDDNEKKRNNELTSCCESGFRGIVN